MEKCMANIRKEQEREELHKAIWNIANDLRGSVDGWDFKQYVLGIMFYRYISENITNYINAGEYEVGNNNFDYAKIETSKCKKYIKNIEKTGKVQLYQNEENDGFFMCKLQKK